MTWTSQRGVLYKYTEMDDMYLANALRYAMTHSTHRNHVVGLAEEVIRRYEPIEIRALKAMESLRPKESA